MKRLSVALLAFVISATSFAYEQATHALITDIALSQSEFGATSSVSPLVASLGLDTYRVLGRADSYYEFIDTLNGVVGYERKSQPYEARVLNTVNPGWEKYPLHAWIKIGAIREDDNPGEDPATPQDVATGLPRPLHHFFDPYNNVALTAVPSGYGDAIKNVDWALGTSDAFKQPDIQDSPRRNHFTVLDAREAMFRALTLKSQFQGSFIDIATGDIPEQERQRQLYWTTALRALGDVLHLNQDMAQPQHTRDEMHSGLACPISWFCPFGHSSVYEKYMRARTLRQSLFKSFGPYYTPVSIQATPLPLATPYRIPNFSKYSDYWSTSPGVTSLIGKGLADYSNRGFFTEGRNFGSTHYPSPSSNTGDYVIRDEVPVQWDGSAPLDPTAVKVYYGQVADIFDAGSTAIAPLTTLGVWDQFLQKKSKSPKYSLNRLNYDAMANLLLPRAVAYSAGLVNFFFRGRILISLPKEGVFAINDHGSSDGFKTLRVKIKNATEAFVDAQGQDQPQHMRGGTFFAVIRYHKDKKYVDSLDTVVGTDPCDDYFEIVNPSKLDGSTECRDGVEQIVVSEPLTGESLDVNTEKTVKFTFANSPIPYAMTDVMLQIVYRGPLGGESDAVAVGSLDIAEPTYFTYQNASDYIHLGQHVYTRAQVDADPSLLALVQPQYCVDYRQSPPRLIDWCLTPFDINLDLSFEDISAPIARASTLPVRRFMRLVYLTTVNETFDPPVKSAIRTVRAASRHGDGRDEKALLYQQSICVPHDPFVVRSRESQLKVLSSTQVEYRTSEFRQVRGVNGWHTEACVINGDNSEPGTPDDRVTAMGSLTPDSDEMRPYGVTIASDYQLPQP
jgi:hypothetical protein